VPVEVPQASDVVAKPKRIAVIRFIGLLRPEA
jgi:hypothetical protein